MKEIPLTQGKITLIDNNDFERVNQYKWLYENSKGYALRREYIRGSIRKHQKQNNIKLHRFILNFPIGQVDHINGNRLDNRKHNLRIVTPHQQSMNKGISKNNTSGIKGVYWNKVSKKWIAYIMINRKMIYLGQSKDKSKCGTIRRIAEKKHFGQFSRGGTK